MRELSPEEIFGKKPLQPTEQKRWKNRKIVAQDYGPEFQARLNELKEKSKELTTILTEKFNQANLPFAIKKDQAGIIRLSFFFRPPFVSSDLSPEQKAQQRHHNAEDEISIFFHLDENNQIEALRYSHGRQTALFSMNLVYGLNISPQEDPLKIKVDFTNLDSFADLLIERFLAQSLVADLQNLLNTKNIETAEQEIQRFISWSICPSFMQKRILQQMISNLCQSEVKKLFSPQIIWPEIKIRLEELIDNFLGILFPPHSQEQSALRAFLFRYAYSKAIPNQEVTTFKNSTLKQAKDLYQKMKFAKK